VVCGVAFLPGSGEGREVSATRQRALESHGLLRCRSVYGRQAGLPRAVVLSMDGACDCYS